MFSSGCLSESSAIGPLPCAKDYSCVMCQAGRGPQYHVGSECARPLFPRPPSPPGRCGLLGSRYQDGSRCAGASLGETIEKAAGDRAAQGRNALGPPAGLTSEKGEGRRREDRVQKKYCQAHEDAPRVPDGRVFAKGPWASKLGGLPRPRRLHSPAAAAASRGLVRAGSHPPFAASPCGLPKDWAQGCACSRVRHCASNPGARGLPGSQPFLQLVWSPAEKRG